MNTPRDILLDMPLDHPWMRGLLMFTFALHLIFVLLTLGTAILGGGLLVAGRYGRRRSFHRWGHDMLRAFFAHKSLAIVLGVAPILLMQVGHSVPFLTGVNLFAPLWLWLVVLLVIALLLIETAGEDWARRRVIVLLAVTGGIACLLAVPGTFAAVVVATENPSRWGEMLARGGRFPSDLAVHWLLRLSHVFVAAVIFTTAWHYLRSSNVRKRNTLAAWMVGGLVVQSVLGVGLYASLPHKPQFLIIVVVLTGVSFASIWLWLLYRSRAAVGGVSFKKMITLSLALFITMLLIRQLLQDQVLVPVGKQLAVNRTRYQQAIVAAAGGSPAERSTVFQPVPQRNATAVYMRSCSFCHGVVGNGQGDAAPRLLVPPENLTGLRMSDATYRRILLEGIPGTAMPRFGFYTRGELDDLLDFLRVQMNMQTVPEPVVHPVSAEAAVDAAAVFSETCSVCHQETGPPTELASGFSPSPPDLSLVGLSPDYDFSVISNGYPGTRMPSFAALPEATRWALVALVREIYLQTDTKGE